MCEVAEIRAGPCRTSVHPRCAEAADRGTPAPVTRNPMPEKESNQERRRQSCHPPGRMQKEQLMNIHAMLVVPVASVLPLCLATQGLFDDSVVAMHAVEDSAVEILSMTPEVVMSDSRMDAVLSKALRSKHDHAWWRALFKQMTTASACQAYSVPWGSLVDELLVRAKKDGVTIEPGDETYSLLSGVHLVLPREWPAKTPLRVFARFSTRFPALSTSGGWSWAVERRDPDQSKENSWLPVASSADPGTVPFNTPQLWHDATFELPGASDDGREIELRWRCASTSKKNPESANSRALRQRVVRVADVSTIVRKAFKDDQAARPDDFVVRFTGVQGGGEQQYWLVFDSLPSDRIQPPAAREFDVTAGVVQFLIDNEVAWTSEVWWDWRRPTCGSKSPWGMEARMFPIPAAVGMRAARKDARLKFTFAAKAEIALRAFCARSYFNRDAACDVILDKSLGASK